MNYINDMMMNHTLETDSPLSIAQPVDNILVGGTMKGGIDSEPNGGFPPIVLCNDAKEDEFSDSDDIKVRQYNSHKNAVSIKQIMDKRKEVTPFISFSGIKNKKK